MSQNKKTENNHTEFPNPEEEDYIPKLLDLRLAGRRSAKYFSIYFFDLYIFYLIFGIIFFNATYVTRNYIFDPDKFWSINMENPDLLKIQKFCAATGMYYVCSSTFSIMDNSVIYCHIIKGGLKRRLQYANFIFLFLQIISFIISLYGICFYKTILIIFPLLFIYSSFTLIAAIIYFMVIRRSLSRENLFLLSIEKNNNHKKNFSDKDISNKLPKS